MPYHAIIARDPLPVEEQAARLIPPGVKPERFLAVELNFDQVFAHLGSGDLFATERAFIYSGFLGYKLSKSDAARLDGLVERMPTETTLVVTQVLDEPSKSKENQKLKSQNFKQWTARARVHDLRSLSEERQAAGWLVNRARTEYGLELAPRQAQRLLAATGVRLGLADGELRKLWMVAGQSDNHVTDSQLTSVLSANPGAQYYGLVDAVMARQPDALERLAEWFAIEQDTYRLLYELNRRFLGIIALNRGEQVNPPYFAQQLRRVARHWPATRLKQAVCGLAEAEHTLKSGRAVGADSKSAELNTLQMYLAGLLAPARAY